MCWRQRQMDQGSPIMRQPRDPGSPPAHDIFAGQAAYFIVYRPGYQVFCSIFFYSVFFCMYLHLKFTYFFR